VSNVALYGLRCSAAATTVTVNYIDTRGLRGITSGVERLMVAKRFPASDLRGYIVAKVLGVIAGASTLYCVIYAGAW